MSNGSVLARGHMGRAVAARILCIIAVLIAIIGLGGCRVSDALTEVIYDQTSDIIDYDNPTKIYINDSTAEQESEEFAAKEVNDGASVASDTVQNLVVYSSKPNTEGFTAKKSVFSPTPDFKGIEASEEVCFVKSDDPNAFDHPVTVEEPEEEPEDEPEEPEEEPLIQAAASTPQENSQTSPSKEEQKTKADETGGNSESDGEWEEVDQPTPEPEEKPETDPDPTPPTDEPTEWTSTPEDTPPSDDNPSDTPTETNTDTPPEEPEAPEETEQGGGNDNGDTQVAYDAADPNAEPPKVQSLAAYGEAATIVRMIGGAGALAATDQNTLSSAFSTVFDTSGMYVGWTGDGSDATCMDVDAIIESGASAVLVYSSAYFKQLSEADQKKLADAEIKQVVIYPLTNSGNIKRDVTVVGSMLQDSTEIQYAGKTVDRASQYVAFHDEVVSAAAGANGGLAGDGNLYETGSDDAVPGFSSNTLPYTLLIDEYDSSATYSGGKYDVSSGLAFASAGWNESPVSYYIQAGGMTNNAAAQTTKAQTGKVVVWQFFQNKFRFKQSEWSGDIAASAKMADGIPLLTSNRNVHEMIGFGSSFGSASFPKLIATTPEIKSGILANSALSNGMYHPYDFKPADETYIFSCIRTDEGLLACIGFDGSVHRGDNLFADGQISEDAIAVNPKGLFADWTQGTVESFLESAWVNDVVNSANGNPVGWQNYVNSFYQTFYDYSLTATDWDTMNPEGA